MDIRQQLESILPLVEKPGRYIGGESGCVGKKPGNVLADIALAFPDVYELGMSHYGTRVLYHLVNRNADLLAERCFAPMPDMAEKLRAGSIPLYSLETFRPLHQFMVVGISLQTELNYTNVPYLLELGGISAFAGARSEDEPLVAGGGACMANPEPVADFFDFFVIGDGEVVMEDLLRLVGRARKAGETREEILKLLADRDGVYVPRFLNRTRNNRGEEAPSRLNSAGPYRGAGPVKRVWAPSLDKADYPVEFPIPNMELVHERLAVEIMRGCTQGCRFCQAGYWYRPRRELHPDDLIESAGKGLDCSGERDLGLLSLSTADYSRIEGVMDYFLDSPDFRDINLSLPSLRVNAFGRALTAKVKAAGRAANATFAPETGSPRLRKMINKMIDDRNLLAAAEGLFGRGATKIKLYMMVGFPTEHKEDLRASCELIESLSAIARAHGRRNRVHVNLGILVPKPFTPLQWSPFMGQEQTAEHINFIRERLARHQSVRVTWADWKLALVESFYARGDRGLGRLIYAAYREGGIFESFHECFDFGIWEKIWEQESYPLERITGGREKAQTLPWDFIHAGVRREFLEAEEELMFSDNQPAAPDCSTGECRECGMPGKCRNIPAAGENKRYQGRNLSPEQLREAVQQGKAAVSPSFTYRLIFSKEALARFLSHRTVLNLFQKAFRKLKIPVEYSRGFSSRPVIKNAGALPLGLASRCELLLVRLREELHPGQDWKLRLTCALPRGIEVREFERVGGTKFPRIRCVRYLLKHKVPHRPPVSVFQQKIVDRRGKEIDLNSELLDIEDRDDGLFISLRTNASGGTVSPYLVFSALTGKEESILRTMRVSKEEIEIE